MRELTPSLTLDELESQITELAGQLNAANYRWLTLIAEYDRRAGWGQAGCNSCAHWLNFKCGLNLGAAREKVRVAHALAGVPKIAAAMSRGELSYSKVRALTRVATPATEDALLMIALHGTAYHVETTARYFRSAMQAGELSREALQQQNRAVNYWYDEDGSLVLKARLPALAGAVVVKALETALEIDATLSFEARRADALASIAERYLEAASGGAESRSSTADRFQVIVHVDGETLRDSNPGRCQLDDGPALPIETVRRLTCDGSLVKLTEDKDGAPLDVGRKTRSIPPAIRRALHARDSGCCFHGCTHTRYLDAHHVEHWADGGQTKLSNLVNLCRTHHRLVHEGQVTVHPRDGGGWRFMSCAGFEFAAHPSAPTPHDWSELARANAAHGIVIDSTTAATRWCGERMDYDLAVSGLCLREEAARKASQNVSAETSRPLAQPVAESRDIEAPFVLPPEYVRFMSQHG